jgi:hypothetical protein
MTTATSFQKQSKVIHKDYLAFRDSIPAQYEPHTNEYTPPKYGKFVQFMPVIGTGAFFEKDEGQPPALDALSEGIPVMATFSTYALAVMCSKESKIEDPLNLFAKAPRALRKSAKNTIDKIVVKMLALAFSQSQTMSDGQPLISGAHLMNPQISQGGPIYSASGLTYSNSLGNSQITPESLMDGDMLSQNLIDDRGNKDETTLRTLLIGSNPVQAQIAQEVVGTPTHPNEINRKKNLQHNRWDVQVWRDIPISPTFNPWFLMAGKGDPGEDCHGLTVWFRWKDGQSGNGYHSFIEPWTQSPVVVISFRLATMAWKWQGIVGSMGGGGVTA